MVQDNDARFREGDERHGIALIEQVASERHQGELRVFELGKEGISASVRHASAGIQSQDALEVSFVFELLDVVAITAGEYFPVDLSHVVTGLY